MSSAYFEPHNLCCDLPSDNRGDEPMPRNDSKKATASTLTLEPEDETVALRNGETEVATNGHATQEDHLQQILKAMVAFREGDFSVRLPLEWSGIDGRIAEAFNQTILHEDHTSREIARLS